MKYIICSIPSSRLALPSKLSVMVGMKYIIIEMGLKLSVIEFS